MRIPPLAVLALAFLTLAPARAQAQAQAQPAPANTPDAVAAAFLAAAQRRFNGEPGEAVRALVANPEPGPSRQRCITRFAAIWGAFGSLPAPAAVAGDQATVALPDPIPHLCLAKVAGQWKVDLVATCVSFPDAVVWMLEPGARPAHPTPPAPAPAPGPAPVAKLAPGSPEAVAAAFLAAAQGPLSGDRAAQEALDGLILDKFESGDQREMATYICADFAAYWGAFGFQPATAEFAGDKATVALPGPAAHFCLTRVGGQWKLDLTATYAGFPEAAHKLFELFEAASQPAPQAPPAAPAN
jgi:hypothetical protein